MVNFLSCLLVQAFKNSLIAVISLCVLLIPRGKPITWEYFFANLIILYALDGIYFYYKYSSLKNENKIL